MQKFLVIQTAFIGDVVLATALIEKLHACYPGAQIDFLVRKGNEALLKGHPWLNEVLVWNKQEHKLRNLWKMIFRIRRARYDKVINVQRFAATGLMTVFSGAGETIGFDKNPLSRLFTKRVPHVVSYPIGEPYAPEARDAHGGPLPAPLHEVERNQALIRHFTDDRPGRPALYPTAADRDRVAEYVLPPYITISPASVWFTKQYPAERWAGFINKLPHDLRIYILGGPGDKELGESIKRMSNHKGIGILAGQLNFLQSAALMEKAKMNYVNDSAPMHFASSVNAPVTAVYCSTIPSFGFGPLSDLRFIVEAREFLDCRPCGLHGYSACPKGHFNCAHHIADEQLLSTLQ